jgi:predicted nucleic-acid-binding protein
LEWVLRAVAGQPEQAVTRCLRHLMSLPGVFVEAADQAEIALTSYQRGMDFADALHLASSRACTEMLTFDDRGFARRARRLKLKPGVVVPRA